MKIEKFALVIGFGAIVYADGKPIPRAPLDRDQMTPPVLYLSHPNYAQTVLRKPTDFLNLGAYTSTGNGLFSFDATDITDITGV